MTLLALALALLALPPEEKTSIALHDVTRPGGINFRFHTPTRGKHDLPEIMGGGVAVIDGDGDGLLDLFFCNGGPIGQDGPGSCKYYRNRGDGTFTDETGSANALGPAHAMGAAVGDYDGDGRDDLFVSGWRGQRLYRNAGGGRFEDVTERAGVASRLWSTSAAWADLDGDGDRDLYVCGYLEYDPATAPYCAAPDGKRDYCGPEEFAAEPDRLYRNNGDATFTDVARASGVDLPEGRGLGVVVSDFTLDGRPDIFVANDGTACWLFENLGGLKFREIGAEAGVAFDGAGKALAGMGAATGDVDGDGRIDLVVTNFHGRGTVVFRALGEGRFADASAALGVRAATRDVNGFGLGLIDLDGDGDLDMVQANGHVLDRARLGTPFAMRPSLLANRSGSFGPVEGGPWFARPMLARGLAVGDLDRDGRPDLVVGVIDGPTGLLRNGSPGSWLTLKLEGRGRRDVTGARVTARVNGRTIVHDSAGGGSYLSASDRRIFLGTTGTTRVERVEVAWPWGSKDTWQGLATSGVVILKEGQGAR